MKKIEIVGITLTFTWLLTIGTIIFLKWESAKSLELNAWGDFLAGVTAPLAFLWLIVGYMLQRQELERNTEALLFQREEMARQAVELKEQNIHLAETAEATRRQAIAAMRR